MKDRKSSVFAAYGAWRVLAGWVCGLAMVGTGCGPRRVPVPAPEPPMTVVSLAPGTYILEETDLDLIPGVSVSVEPTFDGTQWVISGATNLLLRAEQPLQTRLLAASAYSDVLVFRNCRRIRLEGLVLGHVDNNGDCVGDVVEMENCEDMSVDQCDLFGSGARGFVFLQTQRVRVSRTQVRNCTYGILEAEASGDLRFEDCRFTGNREFAMVSLNMGYGAAAPYPRGVTFRPLEFFRCAFIDNRAGEPGVSFPTPFFEMGKKGFVRLEDCRLEHNYAAWFRSRRGKLEVKNCVMGEGQWERMREPRARPDFRAYWDRLYEMIFL